MSLLSANLVAANKTLTLTLTLIRSNLPSFNPPQNPRFPSIPTLSPLLNPLSRTVTAIPASSTITTAAELELEDKGVTTSLPNWDKFAARVSGEWDGFGAEFTVDGKPVELPESVVPEAFREWEVQVFDWQTQCPTLAAESGEPRINYKVIKLLPTVGCEADAATVYSVEERIAGGGEDMAEAFGYDSSGCYVAVWPVGGRNGERVLELEHCLVDPGNREVRVRVIQVVRVEGGGMRLERIKVFSEQWYGPFRNGEQLGGCAIRESGFASTAALEMSEVVGEWQGTSASVTSEKDTLCELIGDRPQKLNRDGLGLVTLPKQLWSSLKENNGETCGEVGWLIDRGCAVTSSCVFLQDGRLKEITIGKETAVLGGI